ncbi:NnrU family protein [Thermosynechococcaceae cyanobacterium BACA0444]|uniref:NnrU family protein n=2 Tax=Pseudocalidococcus TaxID=3110321 RepID=A0AAE4JV09_9CYAN|nr:NnrU family protein [Pseudocalidococcus azoricus]MDS3859875.1 NnrU family protein [Pseudocalidococcus azoricus BACA0444]
MDYTHTWLAPSQGIMVGFLLMFAMAHSGLAALRLSLEKRVGARLYRVGFALVSLTLAVAMIGYFLAHRYDGVQLWQVQNVPGIPGLVWILSAISFLFLYPATFNLLEIAAIQKPQVHLYETGIIRVTRHPQLWGQVIWCLAHTLWLGTSFTLITSLGLIAHHCFGVWHGDRRLELRYGPAFLAVKERTSVIPFLAILQRRQTFMIQEFFKLAYVGVAIFIGLLWWAHPWLYRAGSAIHW